MPCDCSHLHATAREIETRKVANLLVYALPLMSREVPKKVQDATGYYGMPDEAHWLTEMLCSLCRTMDDKEKAEVIWDGRNTDARKLADWYEEHQKVDNERGE